MTDTVCSLLANPILLSLMASSSLSSLNRLSLLPFLKPTPFLKPPSLSSSSSISFQPIPKPLPLSSSNPQPIKSQSQPQTLTLPPNLQQIISLFQSVPDPKSKYQQLLYYGTKLPPYPAPFKNDAHRVRGCVSQVWIRAYPDPMDSSKVRFDADSDSSLTKGLAALLVLGLSAESPTTIVQVSPEFVQLLGLRQSLTPSRNNGFLNMLKLMQKKAAEVGGLEFGESVVEVEEVDSGRNVEESVEAVDEESEIVEEEKDNGVVVGVVGGRAERIRERLERELRPVELEVEDVSHMHAGHAGVRGSSGGETHFNLRVVSGEFEGKSMVKRHRLVYELLREELESGLHALSIDAKTPTEV